MKNVPNYFTLLNLFFGCIAIVYTLQTGIISVDSPEGNQVMIIPEKIWFASLFIALAAVVDFFDGFVARLFKVSSEMGKQLDSLADLVSFGVAPAMIIYQLLRLSIARDADGLDTSILALFPAFLIPCGAAWRLARFNLDKGGQDYSFKGMPVPAAGVLVASFPLIYWDPSTQQISQLLLNKWVLYLIIFLLTYLMVSTHTIMSFKFRNYTITDNWPRYSLVILAIVAGILFQWLAVPIIFALYILFSFIFRKKIS